MKDQIIQALIFPRDQVRSNLNILDCVHGGHFHKGEQICEACEYRDECSWLYHNDECSGIVRKPIKQIVESLQFSLDYIDTRIAYMGHHIGKCHCDACNWLKNTERLVNKFYKVQ